MKPVDTIKLASVKQPDCNGKDIPENLESYVRYLYKPDEASEAEGDNKYRATDPIWSVTVHTIVEIRPLENQLSLYTLQSLVPERTFTREQLQVITSDTEDLDIE